jgi:hypothetical protein
MVILWYLLSLVILFLVITGAVITGINNSRLVSLLEEQLEKDGKLDKTDKLNYFRKNDLDDDY